MRALAVFGLLLGLGLVLLGTPSRAEESETPPLPDRNPHRSAPSKPLLPSEAPSVPWSEAEIAAAKAECRKLLASAAIEYEDLAPIKEGLCGAPAPILVRSAGSDPKVAIDPPATVSCPLAKALVAWLGDTVQRQAKAELGSTVVKLRNATSYACRNRYGGEATPLSEHALANALDISEFVLASGETITVLAAWPMPEATPPIPSPNPERVADEPAVTKAKATDTAAPEPPPAKEPEPAPEPESNPRAKFVKALHDEACKTFGTVLGPAANAAHRDHFHFDMKKRRGAFCE